MHIECNFNYKTANFRKFSDERAKQCGEGITEWTITEVASTKQNDGYNCGVFVLMVCKLYNCVIVGFIGGFFHINALRELCNLYLYQYIHNMKQYFIALVKAYQN